MNKKEYQDKMFKSRTRNNNIQYQAEKQIRAIIKKAYEDIESLLKLTEKDTLTYAFYNKKKKSLNKLLTNLSTSIDFSVRTNMKVASEYYRDNYVKTSKEYSDDKEFSYNWDKNFSTVPVLAVKSSINRIWGDGLNYSDRVWRINQYTKKAISDIVSSGIARGQSSVNMSRELRNFLIDPKISKNVSWTTSIRKSLTGKGTLNYNSLRLARTEINNSYREANSISNQKSPIVYGVKWHLSSSHPIPDICDVWAGVNYYGMGTGVYPPEAMPIDHPNGLCYTTDVIRKRSDWGKKKNYPSAKRIKKEKVLSPLINKSNVTDGQINTAWKIWNDTNKITKIVRKVA